MSKYIEEVIHWHSVNGGSLIRPAGHALRLLNEAVELCLAAGASGNEIKDVVTYEFIKAVSKEEYHPGTFNKDTCHGEVADVQILLDVFSKYTEIDPDVVVEQKLLVLWQREWEADKDGVLWRKGKLPKDKV